MTFSWIADRPLRGARLMRFPSPFTMTRPRRRVVRRRPPTCRLSLEGLEDRTMLSTFMVHNLADGGPDSLRAAIAATNANTDADVIMFAGNLNGTITLASELTITQDLTV